MLDNAVNVYGSWVMSQLNLLKKDGKPRYTISQILGWGVVRKGNAALRELASLGLRAYKVEAHQIPPEHLRKPDDDPDIILVGERDATGRIAYQTRRIGGLSALDQQDAKRENRA